MHGEARTVGAGPGPQARHGLERAQELRTAVRVARVVLHVGADHQVGRPDHLREGGEERQEHGVARGHVGDRDVRADRVPVPGHGDIAGEGRATDRTQVHCDDPVVRDAEVLRHPARGLELDAVALAVVHRERRHLEAGGLRPCRRGGRVQPAREQHDGASHHGPPRPARAPAPRARAHGPIPPRPARRRPKPAERAAACPQRRGQDRVAPAPRPRTCSATSCRASRALHTSTWSQPAASAAAARSRKAAVGRERPHLEVVGQDRRRERAQPRPRRCGESEVGQPASPSAGARAWATITARPGPAERRGTAHVLEHRRRAEAGRGASRRGRSPGPGSA